MIIPFPNQNLRDKVPTAPKPNVAPVRSESFVQKVEHKVASVPMGQLNTPGISIKKLLEKKEEENQTDERFAENLPREKFSFDQVKMLWRRFAFEMKERGMETYYNAMIKREPIVTDEVHFVMEVDNQIQVDYINAHLQDMTTYFRRELKNYGITITLIITDKPQDEVKFLTGKDKFAALARKNPNLHTLKNTFNLDIEF